MGLYDTLERSILLIDGESQRSGDITGDALLYGALAVTSALVLGIIFVAYNNYKENADLKRRGMVRVVGTIEIIYPKSRLDEDEQLELKF